MGVLEGSRAVVTGGASGIGRAIATAFAVEGANVTILDRAEEDRLANADSLHARVGWTSPPRKRSSRRSTRWLNKEG